MNGIQFVTDEKGRKVAVLIDLKRHKGALGGYRRRAGIKVEMAEKGIPLGQVKAELGKRGKARG